MSRSTPRKNRNSNHQNSPSQNKQHNGHARNASQQQCYLQQQQQQQYYQYQYSDFTPAQYAALYENPAAAITMTSAAATSSASASAAAAAAAAAVSVPPAGAGARSVEELSYQVLDRYLGYVSNILHSAHLCVVYAFDPQISNWEKTTVEGTLFVCSRDETQAERGQDDGCAPQARPCIFVFNRKGLNNQIIDFSDITDCEDQGDLLSFKVGESGIGLWVHDENCGRRTTAYALIKKVWAAARQSQHQPAVAPAGHSITVDHLFASIGQGAR